MGRSPAPPPTAAFEEFQATVLFCSHCRAPRPVRERLLLVLPDVELHEYVCTGCGSSVGSRSVKAPPPALVGLLLRASVVSVGRPSFRNARFRCATAAPPCPRA